MDQISQNKNIKDLAIYSKKFFFHSIAVIPYTSKNYGLKSSLIYKIYKN
jgi:hypothetical protein